MNSLVVPLLKSYVCLICTGSLLGAAEVCTKSSKPIFSNSGDTIHIAGARGAIRAAFFPPNVIKAIPEIWGAEYLKNYPRK